MESNILIQYLAGISSLFNEMAPYLILGFIVSGLLYLTVSKDTISKNLGQPGLLSVIKSAAFGVPMPLCSCGVIPVSASLYKRGASKGATLSFLISTPQTGVDSILITYGMLGPIFAIIRPIIALFTGILGGMLTEKLVQEDNSSTNRVDHQHSTKTLKDAFEYAFITLPQDISIPLIKGILIAGLLTLFIPNQFFQTYGITGLYAMLLMAFVSIPMYICATASVPIVASLVISGNLEPGAGFVFLMAGPATNPATISVIVKTLGKKIVYIYLSTIFVCSIIFGLLINQFVVFDVDMMTHHMHHDNLLNLLCSILLFLICLYAIIKKYIPNKNTEQLIETADLTLLVKGMTCNHCKETVTDAINICNGVEDIKINLDSGETLIYGKNLNDKEIITSINDVGFSIVKNT